MPRTFFLESSLLSFRHRYYCTYISKKPLNAIIDNRRTTFSLSNTLINQMNVSLRISTRSATCRRLISTTPHLRALPPFGSSPAPPRLPEEEQKLFEELQKASTGAFSTPKTTVVVNQSAKSSPQPSRLQVNQSPHSDANIPPVAVTTAPATTKTIRDGEELHPDLRRGVQPEFEGDINPKTGEVGGPKNEPLRWGGNVDWSYNGRVTDF
jgi:hypothetical protein